MKARKVGGLDPGMPLADAAERIVRVRLRELGSFAPRALDPAQVGALHDLRIAAKRLRYVLEVTAPCFGSYAATAAKRARQLQDLAGEVHDCDVLLPRVLAELEGLRAEDADHLRSIAGPDGETEPSLVGSAPNRDAYLGLEALAARLQAERTLRFERFVARWRGLERERFRERLKSALSERARPVAPFLRGLPAAREALAFAERAHAGESLAHQLEVGALVKAAGYPEEVVAAGILHDTVEDTDATLPDIEARFGPAVSALVGALTEDPDLAPYEQRKAALRRQVADAGDPAAAVYAADKLSKVRELTARVAGDGGGLSGHDLGRLDHYRRSLIMLEEVIAGQPLAGRLRQELVQLTAAIGDVPPAGAAADTSRSGASG
ncbi:MAG TPA: CHAD domain-containing protein [Solirubrobacteraceae bacterium]|nr:CHAD domain-containing protein [Solirubrobacteraceae bacterium]